MLVIRFQRVGRKNDPAFRIVITEKRSKPKTSGLEIVGAFHPKTKALAIKRERILYWIGQGAHPSPRVHNILIAEGVIPGKKISVAKKKVMVVPLTGEAPKTEAPGGQEKPENEKAADREDKAA